MICENASIDALKDWDTAFYRRNLEEGTTNNNYCTCTFFALRALPRNFVPFVVAYLSWDWDTTLMVPDVTFITTNHPLFSFRHSAFAVNIECDGIECSLLNVANSTRKWLKQLVVKTSGDDSSFHFARIPW
jgi:isoprenylcysteine carboxyl methyltransferase (ICMT) family protein YpbQ